MQNRNRGNLALAIATHVLAWAAILFLPPFAIWRIDLAINVGDYVKLFALPVVIIIVFYANYFVIVDKFLLNGRGLPFVLCNAVLIALMLLLVYAVPQLLNPGGQPMHPVPPPERFMRMDAHVPAPYPPDRMRFVTGDVMLCLLAAGIASAIRMTHNWYRTENRRKELERENTYAELRNLKNQLNPHFLFNALNIIYSFIGSDPAKAQTSMENLCSLLRYALYKSNVPQVPFREEIRFIRDYISLMTARFTENASISVTLPDEPSGTMIAPMLFIPLVENAFKHGMKAGPHPHVEINVEEKDGEIICRTENGVPSVNRQNPAGNGGIGMENLRKRLDILYGGRYMLEYGIRDGVYRSCLIIRNEQ